MREGGELGSGHAIVDRADSNAAEKCYGSLAKHYNIYGVAQTNLFHILSHIMYILHKSPHFVF